MVPRLPSWTINQLKTFMGRLGSIESLIAAFLVAFYYLAYIDYFHNAPSNEYEKIYCYRTGRGWIKVNLEVHRYFSICIQQKICLIIAYLELRGLDVTWHMWVVKS